jgi:hypothetical protein
VTLGSRLRGNDDKSGSGFRLRGNDDWVALGSRLSGNDDLKAVFAGVRRPEGRGKLLFQKNWKLA